MHTRPNANSMPQSLLCEPLADPGVDLLNVLLQLLGRVGLQLVDYFLLVRLCRFVQDRLEDLTLQVRLQLLATVAPEGKECQQRLQYQILQ